MEVNVIRGMSREEHHRGQEFGYGHGRHRPPGAGPGQSRSRSDAPTHRERDPDADFDSNPSKKIRKDAGNENDNGSSGIGLVCRFVGHRDGLGHGGHSSLGQGIGRGQDRDRENNDQGQQQGNDGRPCHSGRNAPGRISMSSNRNERGRGGQAGRGARRGQRVDRNLCFDLVNSRPSHVEEFQNKKKGGTGNIGVVANCFTLLEATDWALYYYRVDFDPDLDYTPLKKKLFKPHAQGIGEISIFDGSTLWTAHQIEPQNKPLILKSNRTEGDKTEEVTLTIRFIHKIEKGDVSYLQFFNIIVRKYLGVLGFEQIGRHLYDKEKSKSLPASRLELWPGFITSMRHHEEKMMLCVDVTHKVFRMDTCHTMLQSFGRDARRKAPEELVGSIVMTNYNRTTYRVDDIDWDKSPAITFDMKGVDVTFADYYRQKYGVRVQDMVQPLLVSRPTKRDTHRGQTSLILLIPELCQMTGLSDQMRNQFSVMRELSQHLHQPPNIRFNNIESFMRRIQNSEQAHTELVKWGLELDPKLVKFKTRELQHEKIHMQPKAQHEEPYVHSNNKADWAENMRSKHMFTSKNLEKWVIIVDGIVQTGNLIHLMRKVGNGLGIKVNDPLEVKKITGTSLQAYIETFNKIVAHYPQRLDSIFFILPSKGQELYGAVKRRCCIDFAIPSQGFQANHLRKQGGLMAIVTKVMIQINAKLGGVPWAIDNPLKTKNIMVIGFDVHHCGKRIGESVGAMVCTTNNFLTQFYSTASTHADMESLSTNLTVDFIKCLRAYHAKNKHLPERIIMYRGGVGEGTLAYVYNTELEQLKEALRSMYKNFVKPRFSMIIVNKKTNTRIALDKLSRENPRVGTVVDDVITLPEGWDFFLISQYANQGTVSPTSYNVIWDEQGLTVDQIQRFTFKMTHLYYNWSGTVAVPAVCQLAHKLAFYKGTHVGRGATWGRIVSYALFLVIALFSSSCSLFSLDELIKKCALKH